MWKAFLIIWMISILERLMVERDRYKLAIDTNGQFISIGYWSIWIFHKGINETHWRRYGGKRLIHFTKYIIPHLG